MQTVDEASDQISSEAEAFLNGIETNRAGASGGNTVSIHGVARIDDDIVLALTQRSHWSGASGIAKYSQVHAFYHGQTAKREWQYRDKHHSSRDNYRYSVNELTDIEVDESGDEVEINFTLVNGEDRRNFTHTFTFDPAEEPERFDAISDRELAELKEKAQQERERIIDRLEELWENKPKMRASYPAGMTVSAGSPSEVPYDKPQVSEVEVLRTGVAYFTATEQIDHRVSDKQMREKLFVMRHNDEEAREVAEDHAYVDREGHPFVRIVSINPKEVVVETSREERSVTL